MKRILVPLCLALLAACQREAAEKPQAVAMTEVAVGHFCQMNLLEHPGPKAQVHLEGMPGAPLFFSQVRDALAYLRMPEQSHRIAAVYVSDMGRAPSWEAPGRDNWTAAEGAWYVVGSDRAGGMGAAEIVPFADGEAAERFASAQGGRVMELDDIPDAAVLAPETDRDAVAGSEADATEDFKSRLRALSEERIN